MVKSTHIPANFWRALMISKACIKILHSLKFDIELSLLKLKEKIVE